MDKKKKKKDASPKFHPDLEGLEVKVNEFGEVKTNFSIDKINAFLNKNVDDKKLKKNVDNQEDEKK